MPLRFLEVATPCKLTVTIQNEGQARWMLFEIRRHQGNKLWPWQMIIKNGDKKTTFSVLSILKRL